MDCPHCGDWVKLPKRLSCTHTMCLDCAQSKLDSAVRKGYGPIIECEFTWCSEHSPVPSGMAVSLPTNLLWVKIQDVYKEYPLSKTETMKCEFCLQGKTNICSSKKSFGVTDNGLFASEIVIASEFLVAVPSDLTNERAILTEPLAVNVHALKRTNITIGTSVAVVGCGTEGLLSIALLVYRGADITVLDINQAKMEKAKEFSKTIKTLHPRDVKNELFDVVIEAAGAKAAIEQAFLLVKPGGALISLGITSEEVSYPSLHITRSEITIYGSIIYTKEDFKETLDFLKDPAFNVSPVLSKIVPLKDYEIAFEDALSGNFTKIVLDFRDHR